MKMDLKVRSQWSGQFFAAGELVRRGYWTAFTMGNVPSTDLVVVSQKGTPFKIEVKTTKGKGQWRPKIVKSSPDLFYIFVVSRLKEGFPPPKIWVMTSREVQRILRKQEKRGTRKPEIKQSDVPEEPGGWEKLPDYEESII